MSVHGRYLSNLDDKHWIVVKKVLWYLQKTKDHMLVYRRVNDLEVIGYIDLDFASCVDDIKSISGYVFLLASRVISWKSVKQTTIASSIM